MANKTKTPSKTHRWPEGAIVYQIYPRSFFDSDNDGIGDINGVTQKLAYIKSLGVNAIWLSPFYPSPMADFGYDVADYCDVDPMFGKLDDMKKLIAAAHAQDIRLMVDLVPNHTSDEHKWFRASREEPNGPYGDWYYWRDPKGFDKHSKPIPPSNWLNIMTGDSAWEWEPARQQFFYHTFHVRQPDLNWTNPQVREAIKDAMRFWLDLGIDGFRVDAVQFMAKDPEFNDEKKNPKHVKGVWNNYSSLLHTRNQSWPSLYGWLSEMASVLKEPKYGKRQLFMVTEAYPNTDKHVKEYLSYFEGMDPDVSAPFIFDGLWLPWEAASWRHFVHELHTTLKDFHEACVASYAFGNHDQWRMVTRLGEVRARAAAILLMSLPGMAFVYNGEELGMRNGYIPRSMVKDPAALEGSGRDPERTPLQWSADRNAGFSTGAKTWLPLAGNYKTRNVQVESKDPKSFLSLYRHLGQLRNSSEALRYGDIEVFGERHPRVLEFIRYTENETYLTVINFSSRSATLDHNQPEGEVLVSSHPKTSLKGKIDDVIRLQPYEAVIMKLGDKS
jgi:alpha-glucosidase